ncbi:hydrolase, partial [Rhodopseudomonas palustris]
VTLDNLRVPFVTSGAAKILSFRSKDPHFKTDPGVLPDPKVAKEAGIDIVQTGAQHTEMSDRGPQSVKERIQATLDQFLSETTASNLAPVAKRPRIGDPRAMGP